MKYGLIINAAQDIQAYILGQSAVPFIEYNESGNWEAYLPKFERQRTGNNQETSACTVFASLSQIETFHKFLYSEEPNYSERFTYNLVPIQPRGGADPQRTHETIRTCGLIEEKLLPMTSSIEEYCDKSRITGSLLAKGLYWSQMFDYKHEWVWEPNKRPVDYIDILKEALKTSPIAVSVSAWNEVDGVYVSNQGSVNNHYCLLYFIDDEGYPWVFDTYDHSKKKLAKDHNIRRAKRIWLNKKTKPAMQKHVAILQNILKALKIMKPTILDVCAAALGTDASPKDIVLDDVACAETVSTLLRKLYPTFPIITGTYSLYEFLNNPSNGWRQVNEYEPGCVVVSPTGTGKGVGHTGIVMEDGTIASNNSFGVNKGRFTKNYTPATWEKRYTTGQKMPAYIFKRVI